MTETVLVSGPLNTSDIVNFLLPAGKLTLSEADCISFSDLLVNIAI